jgi:hypothetical protein
MAENKRRDPSTRSPFAGCSIVLIGILAMGFLVVFVVWNLFKLDEEIAKFTTDDPIPTPVPDLVEDVTAFNDFQSRLQLFKDAEGNGEDTTLALSPHDINLAIATFEELSELRQTFSVTKIADGRMHIAISFPLRGKPMSETTRYLNGTMIAVPSLAGDEIILEIEKILVPDAVVPDGFIGQMSPYRISQRYMEDPFLGRWLRRLTSVSVIDGKLLLTVDAAEADEEELPEDVTPYINRFLLVSALSAVGFILIVAVIGLLIRRKKRQRPAKPEQL